MWQVLVIIMIFAVLGKPETLKEPFQNIAKSPEIHPATKRRTKTAKEDEDKDKDKGVHVTSNYVSRDFVTLEDEFKNPLMNCPQNYEIVNQDILDMQQLSENAFGYTKNDYLDRTRFVDTKTLKEPLPINPDFFMS
jgi:hypothetical protein